MCPLFFIKFLFFHQLIALKHEKCFLFHLKSSFRSQDIFFVFFPSLSILSRFKRTNGIGITYVMNWLAWIRRCNFCNNSKTGTQYNFSERISQPEERLVTSSRLLFFLITLPIKRDWVRKKIRLTFLRRFDNHLSKFLIFKRISCM